MVELLKMLATLSQSKRKGSGSSSTGDLTKLWLSLGENQTHGGGTPANGGGGGMGGGGMGGSGGSVQFSGGDGGAGIDTSARRATRPKVPKQQSMSAAWGTWRPKG